MPVHTSTSTPIATGVKVPSTPALTYVTLRSFSWDQDTDKVKIILLTSKEFGVGYSEFLA